MYTNPSDLPDPPSGWTVRAIEDLCSRVTSGGTPLRGNPAFYSEGWISWFKTGELQDEYLDESEEKITEEAIDRTSAKLLPPDTVLMAMYGDGKTITSLGMLRTEAACNQACCAMITDPEICIPRFLFYTLRHHRNDFIQLATGGAQRNLSGRLIRRFALNVPPLSEQRAIAHILGALDDKIELNRRMNQTLEEIARTLFKSWFVDFDPVRAKAEGREPEGMETGVLADVARIVRRTINPAQFPEEAFDHYSIPAFDSEQRPVVECGAQIKSNKTLVETEAVLISKLNPHIPRVWLPDLATDRRPICSTEFLVVMPNQRIPQSFVYLLLTSESFSQTFSSLVTGTTGSHQRVSPESLLASRTVIPAELSLRRFDETVRPLLARIAANRRASWTLAQIRDTLLPRLLSGELRVREADDPTVAPSLADRRLDLALER